MKKIFTVFLVVSISLQPVFAQPTQAEIDKMMKEAKAEIEKLKIDPANKERMKDLPDMDSLMKKTKGQIPSSVKKNNPRDSSVFSLPDKNNKLLNSLPIRTFNRAELVSYLRNLNEILIGQLGNRYGTDIKNIPDQVVKRSGTSSGLWIYGELRKSVLVALKGAELYPDNTTLLNNAGGILTNCGLSMNAIPILEYALEKQPGNNIILNNPGQAYLDLGDDKKAEQYLLKAVKSYNNYPDANLALAYIQSSRGNKAAAIKFAENSIRGGWNIKAYNMLYKLKPDAKMMDYIRHRYKQPEYFNFHKYPLLPQCENVEQVADLLPLYAANGKMLSALYEKYRKLKIEEDILAQKIIDKTFKEMNIHSKMVRPFSFFGSRVLVDIAIEHSDKEIQFEKYKINYKNELLKLESRYEADMKALHEKWAPELEKLGEGNGGGAIDEAMCKEINALGNLYLPQFALLTTSYRQELVRLNNNYFNDCSYWSHVAFGEEHFYKAIFYGLVMNMILSLQDMNHSKFIKPCRYTQNNAGKTKEPEVIIPDCYLNPKLVLPLGVLKLEISCETYKLEAGEGLVGKVEYDRQKGEFTLAFGVGGAIPKIYFENKALGVEFGTELEAKSQLYITFDNSGTPMDLGILWEAEMKAVAGIGEVKVEGALAQEGLTVGFGSGVQMKEGGALKELIDKTWYVQPDAKQVNKKVPLYKPGI
jgi:hypothetical protein